MSALELGRQRNCAAVLGSLLTAALIVTVHSRCPAPPRFPSAEPKEQFQGTQVFPYGYRVEFVCRPGFVRNARAGNALVCGANGMWRGPSDICTAKACTYPGEPANGRLVLPESFAFGSTVNFSCNTGYRLVGHSEIECVVRNGILTWNRDIPTCQGKQSALIIHSFLSISIQYLGCDWGWIKKLLCCSGEDFGVSVHGGAWKDIFNLCFPSCRNVHSLSGSDAAAFEPGISQTPSVPSPSSGLVCSSSRPALDF